MPDTLTALRNNVRWCLATHAGILTPTGKPKKLPVYWIVKCRLCDELSLNSSLQSKAKRDKCQRHLLRKGRSRNSYWGPMTVTCEGDIDVIETYDSL